MLVPGRPSTWIMKVALAGLRSRRRRGAGPVSTRWPLTFVPLVLPRSLRKQSGGLNSIRKWFARQEPSSGTARTGLRRPPDHERLVAVEDEFLARVRAGRDAQDDAHPLPPGRPATVPPEKLIDQSPVLDTDARSRGNPPGKTRTRSQARVHSTEARRTRSCPVRVLPCRSPAISRSLRRSTLPGAEDRDAPRPR